MEPTESVPDMLKLRGQRRRRQLGLELGAPVGLMRPLDQALEDLPIGNAVLERRELEIFCSEGPQLVAEG
jgi:hypothetical protein